MSLNGKVSALRSCGIGAGLCLLPILFGQNAGRSLVNDLDPEVPGSSRLFQPPGDVAPFTFVFTPGTEQTPRTTSILQEGQLLAELRGSFAPVAATENELWLWSTPLTGSRITSSVNSLGHKTPLFDENGLRLWRFDFETHEVTRMRDLIPEPSEDLLLEGVLPRGALVFTTKDSLVIVEDGEVTTRELAPFFNAPSAPNQPDFFGVQVQGGRILVSQESGCIGYNVLSTPERIDAFYLEDGSQDPIQVSSPDDAESVVISTIGPNCELGISTRSIYPIEAPNSYILNPRSEREPYRLTREIVPGYPSFPTGSSLTRQSGKNLCDYLHTEVYGATVLQIFPDGSGLARPAYREHGPILTEPWEQPGDIYSCVFFFKPGYPSLAVTYVLERLAQHAGFPPAEVLQLLRGMDSQGHWPVQAGYGPARTFFDDMLEVDWSGQRKRTRPLRLSRPIIGYPHHIADYVSWSPSRN